MANRIKQINEMPEVKNYIESIAPDKDVPVLEFRNAQDILLDIKNRFFSYLDNFKLYIMS